LESQKTGQKKLGHIGGKEKRPKQKRNTEPGTLLGTGTQNQRPEPGK